MTTTYNSVLKYRVDRVERAQRLIREAAELLSMQVNDEQMIGGSVQGILDAEGHMRQALRKLSGLATSKDIRL